MMNFYIVDNNSTHIDRIVPLLRELFKSSKIVRKECPSWEDASRWIGKNVPNTEDSVLILDLVFQGEIENQRVGLMNASSIRSNLSQASMISFSQYSMYYDPSGQKVFDAHIQKEHLFALTDRGKNSEAASYVRTAVIKAIDSQILLDKAGFVYSYPMRLVQAAFDIDVLAEMSGHVAGDLSDPKIEALTGGYSGAFVMKISGVKSGISQSIIIKMARSSSILEAESCAYEQYCAELGPLIGVLVVPTREINKLGAGSAYFIKQPAVPGTDLFRALAATSGVKNITDCMSSLSDILLDCCELCCKPDAKKEPFGEKINLTPMDIGRFADSVPCLVKMAKSLQDRNLWPSILPLAPASLGTISMPIVESWNEAVKKLGDTVVTLQHGDLNPKNVFIVNHDKPLFIDLARLGRWPMAYDSARLALQLRMRMALPSGTQDYFADSLASWAKEPVANISTFKSIDQSVCPAAAFLENKLYSWGVSKGTKIQDAFKKAFEIGSMWDLVKIVSYGDLPIFRRVWALHECERLFRKYFPDT